MPPEPHRDRPTVTRAPKATLPGTMPKKMTAPAVHRPMIPVHKAIIPVRTKVREPEKTKVDPIRLQIDPVKAPTAIRYALCAPYFNEFATREW